MHPFRRLISAVLAIAALAAVVLPHTLLPTTYAYLAAAFTSLILSTALAILLRNGGARLQFGIGAIVFLALFLSSLSIGVFFHLPLESALLMFTIISVSGAILLLAISLFVAVRIIPDLLRDYNGEQGVEPDA